MASDIVAGHLAAADTSGSSNYGCCEDSMTEMFSVIGVGVILGFILWLILYTNGWLE